MTPPDAEGLVSRRPHIREYLPLSECPLVEATDIETVIGSLWLYDSFVRTAETGAWYIPFGGVEDTSGRGLPNADSHHGLISSPEKSSKKLASTHLSTMPSEPSTPESSPGTKRYREPLRLVSILTLPPVPFDAHADVPGREPPRSLMSRLVNGHTLSASGVV